MKYQFLSIMLSFLVPTIKTYVASTENKLDDKILEVLQLGSGYLASKTNNTVTNTVAEELNKASMTYTQMSK